MNKNLHLVPNLVEAPVPMTTLRQRIGEDVSDEVLDETLRSELGEQVQFLDSEELYGFVPKWPASRLRGLGSGVLVRYEGLATEIAVTNDRDRRLASIEPILEPIACFEVISAETVVKDIEQYPGGVSNALWVYRVGVSLDQPVRFRTLEDGLQDAQRFAPAIEPPELRLVDMPATMLQ